MTILTPEKARELVEEGFQQLDYYFQHKTPPMPFWWQTIDLNTLDQRSVCNCTVGQPFGDYSDGLEELGINSFDEPPKYGFILPDEYADFDVVEQNYETLNQAWIDLYRRVWDMDKERIDMSWARQYVRNGAKALDDIDPDWVNLDVEFENLRDDEHFHILMPSIRVIASSLGIPVYNDGDEIHSNYAKARGFWPCSNATEDQLKVAWREEIEERKSVSRDWKADMGIIEEEIIQGDSNTLYIVLNGPFSVGLVTEHKEEAESWVSAIASVGQECAIVEKKVGKA
jgi:hypothetical protein